MNSIPENIFRFLAPALAAVAILVNTQELMPAPPEYGGGWKLIGVLFPALWLTGIGPRGLLKSGGFLMRASKTKSSLQRVTYFGLIWLLISIATAIGTQGVSSFSTDDADQVIQPWASLHVFLYALSTRGNYGFAWGFCVHCAPQRSRG